MNHQSNIIQHNFQTLSITITSSYLALNYNGHYYKIFSRASYVIGQAYIGTYQIHKNNDPQSAYAQHILQNIHEFGTLADTMTLLKPLHDTAKLTPYEQLFIQTFHHNGDLIEEQSATEHNPLFHLAKCI